MLILLITDWKAYVICYIALLGMIYAVFRLLLWAVTSEDKETDND